MNSAVTFALSPLSGLYGAAMKARRALYRSGRFRVHDLGVPVISVGNLTTGGTGKTPLARLIARELAATCRGVSSFSLRIRRRPFWAPVSLAESEECHTPP